MHSRYRSPRSSEHNSGCSAVVLNSGQLRHCTLRKKRPPEFPATFRLSPIRLWQTGQEGRTFSARGPFGPCPSLNETCCPSCSSSNRTPSRLLMWKKMSPPFPVSMNPNPFSVSFLIVPSAILLLPSYETPPTPVPGTPGPLSQSTGFGPDRNSLCPAWRAHHPAVHDMRGDPKRTDLQSQTPSEAFAASSGP